MVKVKTVLNGNNCKDGDISYQYPDESSRCEGNCNVSDFELLFAYSGTWWCSDCHQFNELPVDPKILEKAQQEVDKIAQKYYKSKLKKTKNKK